MSVPNDGVRYAPTADAPVGLLRRHERAVRGDPKDDAARP